MILCMHSPEWTHREHLLALKCGSPTKQCAGDGDGGFIYIYIILHFLFVSVKAEEKLCREIVPSFFPHGLVMASDFQTLVSELD